MIASNLIVAICYIFITIIGVVGNGMVLAVLSLSHSYRLGSSTNSIIINLAFADLMFLIFCVPITAISYIKPWPFSNTICYMTVYLQYVTAYASVWTLVMLALDRFLAVVYPVTTINIRNKRTVVIACFLMWNIILLFNLPLIWNVGVLEFESQGGTSRVCVDSVPIAVTNATKSDTLIFYLSFNIFAYVLPLGIISILYALMVKHIWKRRNILNTSKKSLRVKRRITTLVWIIILTFAICWLPQNIRFAMIAVFYPNPIFWEIYDHEFVFTLQVTIQFLAYANSCLNPILYGAHSQQFRYTYQNIRSRFGRSVETPKDYKINPCVRYTKSVCILELSPFQSHTAFSASKPTTKSDQLFFRAQ